MKAIGLHYEKGCLLVSVKLRFFQCFWGNIYFLISSQRLARDLLTYLYHTAGLTTWHNTTGPENQPSRGLFYARISFSYRNALVKALSPPVFSENRIRVNPYVSVVCFPLAMELGYTC